MVRRLEITRGLGCGPRRSSSWSVGLLLRHRQAVHEVLHDIVPIVLLLVCLLLHVL